MSKLTLKLDALEVDSFTTEGRGGVPGGIEATPFVDGPLMIVSTDQPFSCLMFPQPISGDC